MYCKHCGKKVENGAAFCSFCGERIEKEEKADTNRGNNKLLIAIGVIAVLVIVVAGYMAYNYSRTISVDAFALSTEPVYEGYNGEAEIVKSVTLNEDVSTELVNSVKEDRRADLQAFLATVSFVAEPTKALSNDDKIHVTALYDEDLAKEKHIDVVKKVGDYTVSGLENKPEDLSVAKIRESGIIDEVWYSQPYEDGVYDYAYFGTDREGNHKIFYVSHLDFETVDPDDENTSIETFYYIHNTNDFTTDINDIYMATEEVYGQTPKESLDQCLAVIRYEGYSLEQI